MRSEARRRNRVRSSLKCTSDVARRWRGSAGGRSAILNPFQSDLSATGRAAAGKWVEMAAAQSIPVPDAEGLQDLPSAESSRAAPAPVQEPEEEESGSEFDGVVSRLPVELDVAVPVRDFRVRNLLALRPGEVIASRWCNGEDMPLTAGAVRLAWTEFEVIDTQLAVRVTRLP